MKIEDFTFGRDFSEVYITSDLHLSHQNIIKYTGRDFDNVSEMDNYYLTALSYLPANSVIWHLGDFAFNRSPEYLKSVLSILNQNNKVNCLLMGNHDKVSPKAYLDAGFAKVMTGPFGVGKYPIIFSHFPIFLDKEDRFINIHGHTHQNDVHPNTFCSPYYNGRGKGKKVDSRKYLNASVDKQLFLNFQEILENSEV